MGDGVQVRERRAQDLPLLARVLAEQQPRSHYPLRWPLPFPVEEFLVRPGELGAWVATRGDEVVGHASVLEPSPGPETDGWVRGTGLPADRLAVLAVLFVATAVRGRGVGGRLMDTVTDRCRELGRMPVLDVVRTHTDASEVYRARGWQVVGEARPVWLPEDQDPVLLMALPPAG